MPVAIIGILSLLFMTMNPSSALAMEKVLLVTNTYEPYVYTEGDRPGLFPELITEAFKVVGIEVEYEYIPWKRCEMMVQRGMVLGAFPYADLRQHDFYAWHADPVWWDRSVFFYKRSRGAVEYESLEDLRGYRIAGTAGNAYIEPFTQVGLDLDLSTKEVHGILKVFEGRADLFAEEELVGWTLIEKYLPHKRKAFGVTQKAWRKTSLTIMISKAFPGAERLMGCFNRGLGIIRENGVYDSIVEEYLSDRP